MISKGAKSSALRGDTPKKKNAKKLTDIQDTLAHNKTDIDLKIANLRESLHNLEVVCSFPHIYNAYRSSKSINSTRPRKSKRLNFPRLKNSFNHFQSGISQEIKYDSLSFLISSIPFRVLNSNLVSYNGLKNLLQTASIRCFNHPIHSHSPILIL